METKNYHISFNEDEIIKLIKEQLKSNKTELAEAIYKSASLTSSGVEWILLLILGKHTPVSFKIDDNVYCKDITRYIYSEFDIELQKKHGYADYRGYMKCKIVDINYANYYPITISMKYQLGNTSVEKKIFVAGEDLIPYNKKEKKVFEDNQILSEENI